MFFLPPTRNPGGDWPPIPSTTYDAQGRPVSMTYNGNTYFYVLNVQGDVMALLDADGNEVVSYYYNAWGKLLETTASSTGMLYSLALYNPLRYRSYVYDRETGLYYLQSRYYNPTLCRFISADTYLSTGQGVLGYNMFAYCNNNPTQYSDPSGELFVEALLFIGVSAVVGALAGTFTAACTGGDLLEGALEGAALGAVAATATVLTPILLPAASTATVAGVTFAAAGAAGFGIDILTQHISHETGDHSEEPFEVDWGRSIKTAFTTGIAGVVPTYGNPTDSLVNTVGSLIMGFDASFINAAAEIAIVNLFP